MRLRGLLRPGTAAVRMSVIAGSGVAGENWTACWRAVADARVLFWRLMNGSGAAVTVTVGVQAGSGAVTVIGQGLLPALGGGLDVLDSGEELALVNGETAVVKASSAAAGVSFRLGGST